MSKHTPMLRPAFLQQRFENARATLAAFRKLDTNEAATVDAWLIQAAHSGSMTHEERYLHDWINEHDDLPCAEGGAV